MSVTSVTPWFGSLVGARQLCKMIGEEYNEDTVYDFQTKGGKILNDMHYIDAQAVMLSHDQVEDLAKGNPPITAYESFVIETKGTLTNEDLSRALNYYLYKRLYNSLSLLGKQCWKDPMQIRDGKINVDLSMLFEARVKDDVLVKLALENEWTTADRNYWEAKAEQYNVENNTLYDSPYHIIGIPLEHGFEYCKMGKLIVKHNLRKDSKLYMVQLKK